jgi:hypothetical protein
VATKLRIRQGVIKRCRLSWLTNSALVYESKCEGRGRCRVSADEYSCAHHVTWSPNKLWSSNSIFNLWDNVLKSKYLNPGLWQVNLERHLLPHENVGVASLLEQGLQHVQLRTGKGRPFSSLFPVQRGKNSASGTGFQHVKLRPRMVFEQRDSASGKRL